MTNLKDVMSRHYDTIDPDLSIKDAIRKIDTLNLSLLIVSRDRKVHGVLQETDLRRRLEESGRDPSTASVREFMSPEVLVGYEDQDVREFVSPMRQNNIHAIPVLDSGSRMVGLFTLGGPWKRSTPPS
ncbi:MAG TPA: CBS domain-containing protein [Planctomycetota bacterium]|nr:CBS domain-containing protein [Planctomycetota bacterium]